MSYTPKQIKKSLVAGVSAGATLVVSFVAETANWLPTEVAGTLGVVGVALTSISVFLAKNEQVIDTVIDQYDGDL